MSIALYRKWRPQIFEDVVGQEHIIETLKNQIRNNKTSHAYIFTGTRGTGKTSTSKIFAKAVNCMNPSEGEPCGVCESCKTPIDTSMDIIEMDAATNNGVDDIRSLIERLQYPPTKLKYTVVIIDEVHMLSKGAFNSLLKTLEEPASHVIFILATTEPHKIPATIRSRCQIHNFNRIKVDDMVKRLQYVCGEEGLFAETEALKLIGLNSDGAMRDALSMLDQFSLSKKITKEMVEKRLGILDINVVLQLVESILNFDVAAALNMYHYILEKGQSARQLVQQILSVYRDSLLYATTQDIDSIDGLAEYKEKIVELSAKTTVENLSLVVGKLSNLYNSLGSILDPTRVTEYELVKLCTPELLLDTEALLARISILEKELKSIKENGNIVEVRKEIQTVQLKEEPVEIDNIFTADKIDIQNNKEMKQEIDQEQTVITTEKQENQEELGNDQSTVITGENDSKIDNEATSQSSIKPAEPGEVSFTVQDAINLVKEQLTKTILRNCTLEHDEKGILQIKAIVPTHSIILKELCSEDLKNLDMDYLIIDETA
jgi:DNA polymerase-3 subunit gamma/tau